jgi:LacI family transcriptional regulator
MVGQVKNGDKGRNDRVSASPPRQPVRIEEVARAAGVSSATVSRVLNRSAPVSEELRDKVEAFARQIGYVANGAARALASRRSKAFGVVVPNLSNTIFSAATEAFQQRVIAADHTMLLATFNYDEDLEYRNVCTMIERGIDGLMLVGVTHPARLYERLEASGIPFVQTWAPARSSKYPTIGWDDRKLARIAVDHLVGLGHRDIAVVAGLTRYNDRVRTRIAGVRAALRRHKIGLPEERIVYTSYQIDDARAAFRKIQAQGAMPTAMIANNDVVAIGLILEAAAQGVRVPDQLSIFGVGDLELAAHLTPSLTTVRAPREAIGTLAAEYLLARMEGHQFSVPSELSLELVVRNSTAPPPT